NDAENHRTARSGGINPRPHRGGHSAFCHRSHRHMIIDSYAVSPPHVTRAAPPARSGIVGLDGEAGVVGGDPILVRRERHDGAMGTVLVEVQSMGFPIAA